MSASTFDVLGAAGPKQFFSRLTRATLGHAYLFSGAPGVGKKTFARALAKSLLCEGEKAGVIGYDATCASCRIFAAGENTRHPDFLEHVGTLKIGDSDAAAGFYESEELTARDLVRQFSLQSYSGGLRILLLGDIDFATHHAANALLKFFEEPPRNVVLLLTTNAPGRLLDTIRSRVIELRFPLLASSDVASILRNSGYDETAARLGASLGQGSVLRATAALGGDDASLRGATARWFFSVVAGNSPTDGWATRETLDEGIEVLKSMTRDWIALAYAGPDAPLLTHDFAQDLRALTPPQSANATMMLAALDDASRLARTNVSPAMVSELLRMSLCGKALP